MELFETVLVYLHVTFGFAGLAAFWIPVLTRKGGRTHRRFGRIYVYCAYVVLASAAASVTYRLIGFFAEGNAIADNPTGVSFLVFLGYLSIVTFITVRHGDAVLNSKQDPQSMNTAVNKALAGVAIAASSGLILFTLVVNPPTRIVLFALSPIGVLLGTGILKYVTGTNHSPRAWLYEHLGSMLGGGIAFHTAFAVFGSARLFDLGLSGWMAVIPWALPAAIGIPASALWTRHYQKKFGEV